MLAHGPGAHNTKERTESCAEQFYEGEDPVRMRSRGRTVRRREIGSARTLAVQSWSATRPHQFPQRHLLPRVQEHPVQYWFGNDGPHRRRASQRVHGACPLRHRSGGLPL